jgi:hypothetical protein
MDSSLRQILRKSPTLDEKKRKLRAFFNQQGVPEAKEEFMSLATLSDKSLFCTCIQQFLKNGEAKALWEEQAKRTQQDIQLKALAITDQVRQQFRDGLAFADILQKAFLPMIEEREPLIIREVNTILTKEDLGEIEFHRNLIIAHLAVCYVIVTHPQVDSKETLLDLLNKKSLSLPNNTKAFLAFAEKLPEFQRYSPFMASFFESKTALSATPSLVEPRTNKDRLLLSKIKKTENLPDITGLCEQLLDSSESYREILTQEVHIRMNLPLLSAYKLLRFPLSRSTFMGWLEETSISPKELASLKEQIEQEELTRRLESQEDPPTSPHELFLLFYNRRIDATKKYKLICQAKDKLPPEMVKLSLTLLKEKQYPLELTNLRHTLNILDQAKMAEALIEDLEQNSFNLRKKIGGFKKVFGQKIQEAKAKAEKAHLPLLDSLLRAIKKEKDLEVDLLWKVFQELTILGDEANLLKVGSFLTSLYLSINALLLNNLLRSYLLTVANTSEVFITRLLSNETRSSLAETLDKFKDNKAQQLAKLDRFLLRGKRELAVRQDILQDLTAHQGEKEVLKIGKFTFSVAKKDRTYELFIHSTEGDLRLHRTEKNICGFMDFKAFCRRNKIEALIKVSTRHLKLLFHQAHVRQVEDLIKFLETRRFLYETPTPFFFQGLSQIKEALPFSEEGLEAAGQRWQKEASAIRSLEMDLLKEQEEAETKEDKGRVFEGLKMVRSAKAHMEKLQDLLNDLQDKLGQEEITQVKDWAERQTGDLQEDEDTQEVSLGMLEENFLDIGRDNLEVTFLNNRAKDNVKFFKKLNQHLQQRMQDQDTKHHAQFIAGCIGEFQEIRLYQTDFNLIKEGQDPQECFAEFIREVEDFPFAEKTRLMAETLERIKAEKRQRRDYIEYCEKGVNLAQSIMMYNQEIQAQKDFVKNLSILISLFEYEKSKLL